MNEQYKELEKTYKSRNRKKLINRYEKLEELIKSYNFYAGRAEFYRLNKDLLLKEFKHYSDEHSMSIEEHIEIDEYKAEKIKNKIINILNMTE